MKQRDKESLIRSIPAVILVIIVANITSSLRVPYPYRLFSFVIAGAIGGLISYFILKNYKRKNK